MKVSRCSLNSAPSSRSPIGWRSITSLVLAGLAVFVLGGSMVGQDQDQVQNQDEDAATIKTILTFGTMIGDPGSGSFQGSLKSNGALTVTVRGLVLPDRTNPVPFFRAAVSCQDPANSTKGELFFTKTFRADAKGNSDIAGTVSLQSH